MSSPIVNHWKAVEHILCYLKGGLEHRIVYSDHGHNKDKILCYLKGTLVRRIVYCNHDHNGIKCFRWKTSCVI